LTVEPTGFKSTLKSNENLLELHM